MPKESGLLLKNKVSVLNQALGLDFKEFFKNLSKAAINASAGNWAFALQNVIDASSASSIKRECGEIAWLLIHRALHQAIDDLMQEHSDLITGVPENLEGAVLNQLDLSLENQEVRIDRSFFNHPQNLSIITGIKKPFSQWLQLVGLTKAQAQSICNRLPSYFVFALHEQWSNTPHEYVCLKEQLDTPITDAYETTLAQLRYSTWLRKQIDMPMFGEAFSLSQVYVPLRAYFKQEVKSKTESERDKLSQQSEYERIVVDLTTEINAWLKQADKDNAVRLISGGPGSGKSSFAKILAAQVSEQGSQLVLFIPLHLINLKADLVESVEEFVSYKFPENSPFPLKMLKSRLLIIFDGLDELTLQGKAAAEVAQQFVREIDRTVKLFNQQDTRVQILITGREVVVQANECEFRKPHQILHVLPYVVEFSKDSKNSQEDDNYFKVHGEPERYKDLERLLVTDQRDKWWQKYGEAKGLGYTEIPPELKQGKLQEITAQPLLNYLIALSFERKELDFSKETNLNRVYADLLEAVYKRVWENYQHPTLGKIKKSQFIRILEEIGIAAWHGYGRTTSIAEIEKRCENSNLQKLLTIFEEGATQGLASLITAFYFRQSGQRLSGDRTFEFTHKSFGEYLMACRIVRMVETMHEMLARQDTEPDMAWNENEALKQWANLCGPTTMDAYVFQFISDEICLREKQSIRQWQQTLCQLIGYLLKQGMPMHKLGLSSYKEEYRQARNAEEALLAVLNTCARFTQESSDIKWPSKTAFGEWMARLQGQRSWTKNVLAFDCCSYLNLEGNILYIHDLYGVNLEKANLQGAELQWANLQGANLQGANLQWANLYEANLRGADLQRANLQGAKLQGANLERANLQGARLQRANLHRANLQEAYLQGAYLQGANLEKANLEKANLEEANFQEANLQEANLQKANLQKANLEEANLEEANLQGANLEKANLEEANLEKANVKGTILEK
jgi:uncharacterized protein YjbI with pentapeptide repeats